MALSNALLAFAGWLAAGMCLYAACRYLRGGDPLHGLVALIFAPSVLFVAVELALLLDARPPAVVGALISTLYLSRPFLTLRLAAHLGHVRPWRLYAAGAAMVALAPPTMLLGRPYPAAFGVAYMAYYVTTALWAARAFGVEARRRSGTSRGRLRWARAATWASATTTFVAAAGNVTGAARDDGFTRYLPATGAGVLFGYAFTVAVVLAVVGYAVAFVPPRFLRRVWAAEALRTVTSRLLDASPTETPGQLWSRYAAVVRDVTSADHVAVLAVARDGRLVSRPDDAPDPAGDAGSLQALLAARQPVAVDAVRGAAPLTVDLHRCWGTPLLHAQALPMSRCGPGALVIGHQRRSLFTDDDLQLLADLAGQAAVLAERGALLAQRAAALAERENALTVQHALADELTASVHALTDANNAKSAFLAAMSHELRTPLNAIIGFSDMIKSDLNRSGPGTDNQHAAWVGHILTSGRHLLGLINNLLDLAKVEAGGLDLHRSPVRLDDSIGQLVDSLHPLADRAGVTLHADLDPVRALVDPLRLRQIAENLLSNAIKFTPEGGEVRVAARVRGSDVLLEVSDTGVGIAPADADRIFTEFVQAGAAGQRAGGTGLGLALVRRIAHAHGGDITLRSTPGVGSVFTVQLPDARLPLAPPEPAGPTPAPASPTVADEVLVIEDDPAAAEMFTSQLHAAGYRVVLADSGETGMEIAHVHRPRVILLDLGLPGISGWETLRRLRADPDLDTVPVVVISVLEERGRAREHGADAYLVKPVAADVLHRTVEAARTGQPTAAARRDTGAYRV
ncbi:hypothetical protein GCM10010124_34490 [Pilimelia terevasa]|uniref:histidine kinase n=1 Tax=Pilimelia terevasa TaxID=53372 RepID=A0A8J3BTJ0_9ACTN|nr:ATP-binding protein [Pilimelia terevasa]GGK38780.1 hypothetical protein GCM10010124_34490 [Pilimelia terevasa]